MPQLTLTPNIEDPDGFYEELIQGHKGLSDEQSALMNSKLVLLLANQVGSRELLSQAIALARPKEAGVAAG